MLNLHTLSDIDRKLILEAYISDVCSILSVSQRVCREDPERYASEEMYPFVADGEPKAHSVCGGSFTYDAVGKKVKSEPGWGTLGEWALQCDSGDPL